MTKQNASEKQESLQEYLSAFMDDELHDESTTRQVLGSSELREQWSRYHLIRDVMQGHVTEDILPNFSERVSAAIADEPTVLVPRAQHWARRVGASAVRHISGFAIAATVAFVTIVSVQMNTDSTNDPSVTQFAEQQTSFTQMNPLIGHAQPASVDSVLNKADEELHTSNPASTKRMSRDLRRNLRELLDDHDFERSQAVNGSVLPYAKMVSNLRFTPSK